MAIRGSLAFTDADELEAKIDEYFDSRWATRTIRQNVGGQVQQWEESYQRPPTMAGLALALGVTRQTLLAYGRGDEPRDPAFVPIIAKAKGRIAEFAEEALYVREASAGAKFALEVNHGYGREALGDTGTGEGFAMKVIPPAVTSDQKAIPRWSADDGEE